MLIDNTRLAWHYILAAENSQTAFRTPKFGQLCEDHLGFRVYTFKMPLPKRPTVATGRKGTTTKDARFANFETDPKFRLPSKKHAKTKLDSRFSRLLTDPQFHSKGSVDRYGRRISSK